MSISRKAWFIPEEEPRLLLQVLEPRIEALDIDPRHRDALIRFRVIVEEDRNLEWRLNRCFGPSGRVQPDGGIHVGFTAIYARSAASVAASNL
jgi:hypothetical protein